ncbi:galactose-1-phosphate uridylyltransferase [Gordonia neofelifaecis]|uniref:Galactose-1-phosphate uridylyltransferase n=1 Tax=Gordonia neofelifaecis NRRL B-59395 TaxID=644548 RepID=F1YKZ6_9ACTN|nr:galactose-1-phosphate uridylyltransferase [Gordonia neofelifaecis]EGD54601.1 galactose-1-phosphate uridylyltransferase [Gordonia neofelifaecis NRRL B-59395]
MSAGRTLPEPNRGRLSDGREILLFDVGAPPPLGVDRRDLPPRPAAPQTVIRRDPVTGDEVVISPARQDRTHLPPRRECPLCPDPDGLTGEIPAADYRVAVFENRFPSLAGSSDPGSAVPAPADDLRAERPGVGRCEVVCFTSDHDGSFGSLPPRQARLAIDVLAHRTEELLALDEVTEVHCFENRGEEVGVTLAHPHGQIYAYPFITPRTESMMREAARHRARTGDDLFDSILAHEVDDGERILVRTALTTAFVPYAARWPVEAHVYPNRGVRRLAELTDDEADDLAAVYQSILRACDALYDRPLPYVASWHQYRIGAAEGRLHAEVFSIQRSAEKLKYLAGSESARDAFITDKTPEDIAAGLRAALDPGVHHG